MALIEVAEYVRESEKTAKYTNPIQRKRCVAFGLIGEVGEVAEILKKFYRDGGQLDLLRISEELGDVLWYVSRLALPDQVNSLSAKGWKNNGRGRVDTPSEQLYALRELAGETYENTPYFPYLLSEWIAVCHCFGLTPADVAQQNLDKLQARYA